MSGDSAEAAEFYTWFEANANSSVSLVVTGGPGIPTHSSKTTIKFVDDTAVVVHISNDDEAAGREEVAPVSPQTAEEIQGFTESTAIISFCCSAEQPDRKPRFPSPLL